MKGKRRLLITMEDDKKQLTVWEDDKGSEVLAIMNDFSITTANDYILKIVEELFSCKIKNSEKNYKRELYEVRF
jgi:hypothetical protein